MRSPYPTPGRNTVFENIWQAITSFSRTLVQGSQRPRSQWADFESDSRYSRRYDLEITEPIVRSNPNTRLLVEAIEHCSEMATAIEIRNNGIWGSLDGDDQGFAIAPTLNDNVTPVDPEVYKILQRLIDDVIGGLTLKPRSETFLEYGDAFMAIGVNTRKMRIERVLPLPTFEVFRVEDNQGQLQGFEQRRTISDNSPVGFHPLLMVHWRYRLQKLYGRSLFEESLSDWVSLRRVSENLDRAGDSVGINANIHLMPCEADDRYVNEYKRRHKEQIRNEGAIVDYYINNGGDVRKVSTTNPDFRGLLELANFRRLRIAMKSGVPLYLLGIPWDGGKDIAMQPSLNFVRGLNADRMVMTAGLKHLCNLELALNGIEKERWQYRIIWPKIYVNPFEEQPEADESNQPGIEDLDYLSRSSDAIIRKELAEILHK